MISHDISEGIGLHGCLSAREILKSREHRTAELNGNIYDPLVGIFRRWSPNIALDRNIYVTTARLYPTRAISSWDHTQVDLEGANRITGATIGADSLLYSTSEIEDLGRADHPEKKLSGRFRCDSCCFDLIHYCRYRTHGSSLAIY